MITVSELWPLVGVVIAIFGVLQAALAMYVRYLILQHQVNCPYPKAFADALKGITSRVIAVEQQVDRHTERHPGASP